LKAANQLEALEIDINAIPPAIEAFDARPMPPRIVHARRPRARKMPQEYEADQSPSNGSSDTQESNDKIDHQALHFSTYPTTMRRSRDVTMAIAKRSTISQDANCTIVLCLHIILYNVYDSVGVR